MELLAINPRKPRRAKRRRKTVLTRLSATRKRRTRRSPATRKTTVKRRPKKRAYTVRRKVPATMARRKRTSAPHRRRAYASKRVYKRRGKGRTRAVARKLGLFGKQTIMGLNIPTALKNTLPLFLGALAGKFVAKRFADSGSETDNWTWKNYLFCAGGAGLAAILLQAITRRPGLGQKVFEGGMLLTAYKLWTNDIAPRNATLQSWFGADADEDIDSIDPYAGLFGEVTEQAEGDYEQEPVSGYFRPIGGQVMPATAQLGGIMQGAGGQLGAETNVTSMFDQAYR